MLMKKITAIFCWIAICLFPVASFSENDYSTDLATAICRDKLHFGTCFSLAGKTCESVAHVAIEKCLRAMPAKPRQQGTLDQDIINPFGIGAWSKDVGLCGETFFARENPPNRDQQCTSYFLKRENDLKNAAFKPDFAKVSVVSNDASRKIKIIWIQFLSIMLSGTLAPFFIAWRTWKASRPRPFPWHHAAALIIVSIAGIVIDQTIESYLGLFSESVRLNGDNPTASLGSTFGFIILIPIFWLGLAAIYNRNKSPGESSSGLLH